ncbi:RHO1 GDP-GTP exchange protein 1 [Labeo rohita]|uniref:RHO1 GDP-GTP exchange protein 1 n=1 Tax=Labeo rohita TaxID=84645 RepID=A0ABQ8M3Y2_LABRO|nr:RHO1 GDP-GTP exchange protein 1 [Labeo rohita]
MVLESLVTFIEWDQQPSPPSPLYAELPEPTADGELKPVVTHEPLKRRATEPRIALELESDTSDQVREPATKPTAEEITVGREGTEGSPAHCTAVGAPLLTLSPPSVAWARRWTSSSLISTGARQSTSSTGLPRPSGSALVSCPPNSTSGLHSSGCASSFRPSGSVGLCLPSSSTSGSSASPWLICSPSPPRAPLPAPPLLVGPLESSALHPPWLLPPSAPPWAMAAAWALPGSCTHPNLARITLPTNHHEQDSGSTGVIQVTWHYHLSPANMYMWAPHGFCWVYMGTKWAWSQNRHLIWGPGPTWAKTDGLPMWDLVGSQMGNECLGSKWATQMGPIWV